MYRNRFSAPLLAVLICAILSTGTRAQPALQAVPQPFTLVEDIGSTMYPGSSLSSGGAQSFQGAFVTGGTAYFQAFMPDTGYEFWRSDGTAAGTMMLKDICPGADDTFKTNYATLGAQLVFVADDCATGKELWITDGTTAGTRRLKDINPGAYASNPEYFVIAGSTLFFSATSGTTQSLWKSNGTAEGTTSIDIYGTPVAALGSLLIYTTYESSVCRLKALSGGTITDLAAVCPEDFRAVAGTSSIYFTATTNAAGKEIWVSNGTAAGTHMLADLNPGAQGSEASQLTIGPANQLYFSANNGSYGRELWWTDGVSAPIMLKDMNAGTGSSDPSSLTMWNNILFFTAYNGTQVELWRHSFPGGVVLVKDLTPTAGVSSYPAWLTATSAGLFFTARDDTHARALYKTDGSSGGTLFIKDFSALGQEVSSLTALGAGVLFLGNDGSSGGEPWFSDGTSAGTAMIKDIVGATTRDLRPFFATPLADHLLYFGYTMESTPGDSYALYSSDGSAAGTQVLTSLSIFLPGDHSDRPAAFKNALFFPGAQSTSNNGNELWRSDGTAVGTMQFLEINPGMNSSSPRWLTPAGATLFFSADDSSHGVELWKTGGTPETTTLVKDIQTGTNGSYPQYLTADGNGGVYFSASDGSAGTELWYSDGTDAHTRRVLDIWAGNGSSSPENLITVGDQLFFTADDGASGRELWISNGTPEGTRRVRDISVGTSGSSFGPYRQPFVAIQNRVFFTVSTPQFGQELWVSDGTEQGTLIVKDVYPGSGTSAIDDLMVLNGMLYFAATGSDGISTLWQSDGTTANTRPMLSGSGAPINPQNISALDGLLYFSAADLAQTYGQELWISDGTAAGTRMHQDLNPGTTNSNPDDITKIGERMYLNAYSPGAGIELWSAFMQPDLPQYTVYLPVVMRS